MYGGGAWRRIIEAAEFEGRNRPVQWDVFGGGGILVQVGELHQPVLTTKCLPSMVSMLQKVVWKYTTVSFDWECRRTFPRRVPWECQGGVERWALQRGDRIGFGDRHECVNLCQKPKQKHGCRHQIGGWIFWRGCSRVWWLLDPLSVNFARIIWLQTGELCPRVHVGVRSAIYI